MESSDNPSEAIRIVNDALSCIDNRKFLRQLVIKIDEPDPKNPVPLSYFIMPVKLDFPDQSTRNHFEKNPDNIPAK
jgi:hypothetical protein